MEPQWTKQIPSDVICNFFYIFFIVYAVLAALALVSGVGVLLTPKLPKGLMLMSVVNSVIVAGIAGTAALFHYLVCSRALLPAAKKEGFFVKKMSGKKH